MNLILVFRTREKALFSKHLTNKKIRIIIMEFAVVFPQVALHPLFPDRIRSVDFCGVRKTGEPGEKPSEQGLEPTRNSTHI